MVHSNPWRHKIHLEWIQTAHNPEQRMAE
ncbi:hypothetical protein VCHE09_0974, partial [Vibrio paracholerae HE-09]